MKILFIILGALIGAALLLPFPGAALGAVIGYLLGAVMDLSQRLTKLEAEVRDLGRLTKTQTRPKSAPAEEISIPQGEEEPLFSSPGPEESTPPIAWKLVPREPAVNQEEKETGAPRTEDPPITMPPFEPQRAASPQSDHTGKPSTEPFLFLQRWFSSENLLVKVGIIILFFGVAFLLKYAAEKNWFPIEARVTAVALGAIGLLVLGWRLRSTRRNYAMALQGGGIGVLYLTVFTAMRLYGLIPVPLAFAILAAVGVLSGALAVLQDSRALAFLGMVGGFLAPILASTGRGSHVLLFSYYAVLDACILGMTWFKAWRELNLAGFLFTFSLGTAWGSRYYHPGYFATVEPFLILFFLFYIGVPILYALRRPPELKGYVDGTLVFGTPVITLALQSMLVKSYPYGLAWSAFALGFFYLGIAWVLFLRSPKYMRMLTESFLAIGVAFGTLAIPLALDNRWTAGAWALEGAATVWIGVRQQRMLPRAAGILLQLGAGVFFLAAANDPTGHVPVFNGFYLGCLTISLAGLFSAFYLDRHRGQLPDMEAELDKFLAAWGLLWWFAAGLSEIDRHIMDQEYRISAAIAFLTLSCVTADDLKRRLDWPILSFPSLALPVVLLPIAAALNASGSHPFAGAGYVTWPLAVAACYWILKKNEDWLPTAIRPLHVVTLWLLALAASLELSWQTNHWVQGAGTWPLISWAVIPSLLVLCIARWGEALAWPVAAHFQVYLWPGAGVMALALAAWTWIVNLSSSGDPWPLAYLPLLNPLDVAVAFAFLTLTLWILKINSLSWPSLKAFRQWMPKHSINLFLGASIFLWINAILVRTIHHWGGVPFSAYAMQRSVLFQTSLSILWSLTALGLMVFSTRRGFRNLWFTGGGLLAVVVLKLFLVDLSKTGTVERIVSFLAVGILLLIVGYFSPVPPNPSREVEKP